MHIHSLQGTTDDTEVTDVNPPKIETCIEKQSAALGW